MKFHRYSVSQHHNQLATDSIIIIIIIIITINVVIINIIVIVVAVVKWSFSWNLLPLIL